MFRRAVILLLCFFVLLLVMSSENCYAQSKKQFSKSSSNRLLGLWTAKDKNSVFVPSDVEFTPTELISPGAKERNPVKYIIKGKVILAFPKTRQVRICVMINDDLMACEIAVHLRYEDYDKYKKIIDSGGKLRSDASPLGLFVRVTKTPTYTFGIGIEAPPAQQIENGVLVLRSGGDNEMLPGHTFAYLKDEKGKIVSVLSIGPEHSLDHQNKQMTIDFLLSKINARPDWIVIPTAQVFTYEWEINQEKYGKCKSIISSIVSNPGKYSPAQQCTSDAIAAAKQCEIPIPDGVSQVRVEVPDLPSYVPNVFMAANPFGLKQQLDTRNIPGMVRGTTTGAEFQKFLDAHPHK